MKPPAGERAMQTNSKALYSRGTLVAAIALLMVFGMMLVVEGRPVWCKYGFGLWSAAWRRCTSQQFLDPYSLTHVLHGIIFYWLLQPFERRLSLRWRLVAALAIEVGWELLENSPFVIDRYRRDTASLDYTGDSMVNSFGDIVATIVGFVFASRVSWKVALAFFIVVELGLLLFVRDNLTLNIFMLFSPLESLKEWQLHGW
jgi:hypothetical protein